MSVLARFLLNLEQFQSEATRLKAIFLYLFIGLVFVSISILFITRQNLQDGLWLFGFLGTLSILTIGFLLTRAQQVGMASWLLLLGLSTVVFVNMFTNQAVSVTILLFTVSLIFTASFLLNRESILFFMLLCVLEVIMFPLAGNDGSRDYTMPLIVLFMAMGGTAYFYSRYVDASRLAGQLGESGERSRLVKVSSQLTQLIQQRADSTEVIQEALTVLQSIYDEMDVFRVFLLEDDHVRMDLVASTTDDPQESVAAHQVAVGGVGVIGQASYLREIVFEQQATTSLGDRLPSDRDYLCVGIPLLIGDQLIGCLNLESARLIHLTTDQQKVLQAMANMLVILINSVQQFNVLQASERKNQQLMMETQVVLNEVERLNQQLTDDAWRSYMQMQQDVGLEIDFETGEQQQFDGWTDNLLTAIRENNIIQNQQDLALPLRVRGQVIGAIEFEFDEGYQLSPEDFQLLSEVNERFGLTAENTRLVDKSQQIAQREAMINHITSQFQVAQSVETTLAEAARSISKSLKAERVMIRLGLPDNTHTATNDKGA